MIYLHYGTCNFSYQVSWLFRIQHWMFLEISNSIQMALFLFWMCDFDFHAFSSYLSHFNYSVPLFFFLWKWKQTKITHSVFSASCCIVFFPPCCSSTWLFSSVKMKLFQNLFPCHLSKNVMECKCTSTDLLEIQFSSILTSCFFYILQAFQLSIFIDEAINSQNTLNLFHDLTHILKNCSIQFLVYS